MNGSTQESLPLAVRTEPLEARAKHGFVPFFVAAGLLTLGFSKPLYDLVRFSLSTELFSHILLIPFLSLYLVWTDRSRLPQPGRGNAAVSIALAAAGAALLGTGLAFFGGAPKADRLFFSILFFYSFFVSAAVYFLGTTFIRAIAFPLGFLIFMVPFPERVTDALEIASQHASANAYAWLMSATQATYFREGMIFSLPGLTIQVAQECSGIRSSFVLFITSLLAGHMFLHSPWRKLLLALFVFPLGIARNAFRIYVISMLSAHWDPRVIDSPLHHKGGPIFFALSLIPFFLLLFWLRRGEAAPAVAASASNARPS
jgi:exosortase C (VPDSG-CTERM-specific)